MYKKAWSKEDSCPKDSDLELYMLKIYSRLPYSREIQTHVKSCPICQDRLRQLQEFYQLLDQEISRPIPNEVYLLAQELEDF